MNQLVSERLTVLDSEAFRSMQSQPFTPTVHHMYFYVEATPFEHPWGVGTVLCSGHREMRNQRKLRI